MSTTTPEPDEDFAPPPEPRPPRRWPRRLRKFALFVFALSVVVALVLYTVRWQLGREGQRQLNAETERLDADEPGWRLDAIQEARKKAEPPAGENSAPLVIDIGERLPDEWKKWRNSDDAMAFWGRPADNHLPPQSAIDAARKHAADTFFLRADAVRLRDKRGGSFPLTFPDDPLALTLPHLDRCRQVVSLVQYDAYLAATAEKNPNRGVSAARAALAVARAIGDEPLLISQLVRIACATVAAQTAMQVLAWCEPTEGLAELQAELLAEADTNHFHLGMRGERAVIDRTFRGLEEGTIPAEHWFRYVNILNPGPQHYAYYRAYRALLPGDHAKSLELATEYLKASKLPPHERRAALKQVEIPKGPPDEIRYIMTRLLIPACDKVAEAGIRCRADLLAAATCVACERFRLKHNRWPLNFEELIPAYLPAMPDNPFLGVRLAYRVFPDRIAVYAFWPNSPLKPEDCPEDFRPGNGRTYAIGYRVWNPARRGLKPEEKKAEEKNADEKKAEEKKDP